MIRKLLLALTFAGALSASALAGNSYTAMLNANYTATNNDVRIVPTVALTANRTITLPYAAATCIGSFSSYQNQGTCGSSLEVVDAFGTIGGANSCIIITAQTGDLLNGVSGGSLTLCGPYSRAVLRPEGGSNWQVDIYGGGQTQGTTTNDSAQPGYVGQEIIATCPGNATTATVTTPVASPGIVTWTAHGITAACAVSFSGGTLPTGISSAVTYYVIPSTITANTFEIATTVANALAATPTAINFTGSSSGTQTGVGGTILATTTAADIGGVSLTAGDWDCRAVVARATGSSFAATVFEQGIGATAATIPTQGTMAANYHQTASDVEGALGFDHFIGPARFSLSATTVEHLAVDDTFSAGSDSAFGTLDCRRVR